jgi:hypothetical protein
MCSVLGRMRYVFLGSSSQQQPVMSRSIMYRNTKGMLASKHW